jgi:hypothetical protein
MNAGRAIYEILTTDTDLAALVSNRIFPEAAPEGVESPFVVYSVQSVEPIRVKNSTSTMDTANFEVYTSSIDYAEAMSINDAIRTAMERRSGTFSTVAIDSVEYIDENVELDFESREYVSELRFRLRIARTGHVSTSSTIVPLGMNVRETDETDVQFVKTMVFPDTSLSVSEQTATVTFTTGGGGGSADVQMVGASMTSTTATFNATETQIPLGSVDIDTGSSCQISNGKLRVGTAGTASVSVHLVCRADTNHQLPHVSLYHGDRELIECTGYITGQHGDDHTSLSGTVMVTLAANDLLELKGYNDGGNNTIAVDFATVSFVMLE